jgi:hypothetical protein
MGPLQKRQCSYHDEHHRLARRNVKARPLDAAGGPRTVALRTPRHDEQPVVRCGRTHREFAPHGRVVDGHD